MNPRLLLLLLAIPARIAASEDAVTPLSANPAIAAHVLSTARKDLKDARGDFKSMSPDERAVVADARQVILKTADWRALVPALGAAADLLEGAGATKGDDADLCACMARNYRAMAEDLDKDGTYLAAELRKQTPAERAATTFAEAEKLLAARADVATDEDAGNAWNVIRRNDPRWSAFALNFKTLARAYATLAEQQHGEALAAAVANASKLHKELETYFKGVKTKRDDAEEPEPQPAPEAPRPRVIKRVG
ncbi:MAG TPA: hypothetical protein VFY93_08445 [Planctomycetota bacterium]|nr:hypothetical protein [Planctomycetota bacterium]